MKKLISALLVVIMVLSILPISASAAGFVDVPEGLYCYDAVNWAVANGITRGKSDGTFGTKDNCIRRHVMMFLWRSKGCPEPASMENPFEDVKHDSFEKAILWAYYAGVTTGQDSTHFNPEGICTRKQIVTFLWRAAGKPESANTTSFPDVKQDRFAKPILWAAEKGITGGYKDGTFRPEASCTRGQIVTFLYRQKYSGHVHSFGTEWKHDKTHHWHECSCGEKNDSAEHTFGDWILLDSPTEDFNGLKKRYCSVCNYRETVIIPALGGHEHTWGEFVKGKPVAEHKYFTEYEYVSTCTQCDKTRTTNKKEVNQAYIKQVAGEMVEKVNALRKEKGLNTLWTSREWDQWAEKRAFDLHANFSHDGAEHLIGNQKVTRENILEIGLYGVDNMGDTMDAEFFFRRFASSDGHLANMLVSPAHGIAVALNLDPETGDITCAMSLVLDEDQYIEDQKPVDPAVCNHIWEEESREITNEAGVRIDFIQHLVCHKCGSKDVKSGFEINDAKIAAFAGQTIAEVNKERSDKGLNTLTIVDGEAAAYTQRRANALVNDFSHNGMGGMYGGYHNQSENIAALPVGMASGYEFYASFRDSKEGHHEAMLSPNITYISVAFAHDDEYVYCAMEMFYRPADLIEQTNDSVDEDPAAFNLLNLTDEDYENDPILMQSLSGHPLNRNLWMYAASRCKLSDVLCY